MGKKKSWMQLAAEKCLRLVPVMVLLAAHALAESRKPVANPDPEYPEIARHITREEFLEAMEAAKRYGLTNLDPHSLRNRDRLL